MRNVPAPLRHDEVSEPARTGVAGRVSMTAGLALAALFGTDAANAQRIESPKYELFPADSSPFSDATGIPTDNEVRGKRRTKAPALSADGRAVPSRRDDAPSTPGQRAFQNAACTPLNLAFAPFRLAFGGTDGRRSVLDLSNQDTAFRETMDWLKDAGEELKDAKYPVELRLTGDIRTFMSFCSAGALADTGLLRSARFEIDPRGSKMDFLNSKDFTTTPGHKFRRNAVQISFTFHSVEELRSIFSKK